MVAAAPIVKESKVSPVLIRNLYYLLLYAWELYSEGVAREVEATEAETLQNLLAKVLGSGARRLLRRGMDRAYQAFVEETATPRGSFLFTETMRPGPRSKGTAVCSFDELTSDVAHNQVIKATLRLLSKSEDLAPDLRIEIRILASKMANIRDLPLSSELFRSVHLGRYNRQYRLLVKICEMIFLSQIPGEGNVGTRFASLLDDEQRMAAIFERFVRNLYRAEQTAFRVRAEEIAWDATFSTPDHSGYLPQMRTDMTMRRPGRTLVIDTKYYREVLRSRMGGVPKLRSEHLYQLLTYLRHVRSDSVIPHIPDGILLYARADGIDFNLEYVVGGFRLRAYTIDLNLPWLAIRQQLLGLISEKLSPEMQIP